MAEITTGNLELLNRFVAFTTTLLVRQKATEIALTKLGITEESWTEALEEARDSVAAIPFPQGEHPLEAYLETVTKILRNQ